ncbi:Exportin 7 [Kappamyces sp. JEL0680]|nr:Exportin 7 [Kappamyces sp. JEL0680]
MDSAPLSPNEIQEIENICSVFQYSSAENMQTIQQQLAQIFVTQLASRAELFSQLSLCLKLLCESGKEIVHSVVQSHLKVLLTTKHHLFTPADLQGLSESLAGTSTTFHATNRFLLNSFIQLHAIITVLGWLEVEAFPARYTEMVQDAESPTPSPYSLPSLQALVQEMNPDTSAIKNFGKHRRTAVSFRDSHLKLLLQTAFRFYLLTVQNPNSTTELALGVITNCLSFDFLGTMSDQDNHGMTSAVQIPSSLKSWILEEKPMDQLAVGFETWPENHDKLLEALSWLMGCRRSLFLEEERMPFFDRACEIITQLLTIEFDEDAKIELLKLLLRFTSVYSNDMKKGQNVLPMLEALLGYTKKYLPSSQPTEFLFFVQIWVQLRDSEHLFFVERLELVKELTVLFINIPPVMLKTIYFDDENTIEQVLSPIGKLLRQFSTEFTAQIVAESSDDANDGMINASLFRFVSRKPIQTNPGDKCEEQLELSILNLFEQFKHTFLTGDGSSCPQVWEVLAAQSDFSSQEHVVILFLQRALQYLKDHTTEALILKSVVLFKELVNGVRTLKLLQTPEIMAYIESSGIISFHMTTSFQKSKCLTVLFENIGRLFMNDLYQSQPEPRLLQLLEPISFYLMEYENGQNDGSQMDLVVRKLRGILSAIYSSKLFKIFFDWLRPHMQCFSVYLNSPLAVNGPVNIMKFIRDLVCNKVSRLTFETSAEYGILLFREAVALVLPIVVKLENVLSQDIAESVWEQQCLKPIVVILDTFKNAINSRAVPFGILRLYNDAALAEMIQSVYIISSFISPNQLLQYSKLGAAYFNLWVCMTSDNIAYLSSGIPDALFARLCMNSYAIIQNLDNSTSSQACTFISAIYTEMHDSKKLYSLDPQRFHTSIIPLILYRILGSDTYIETQWSFTRPLFPLVLYDVEWFHAYLNHLVQIQPPECQDSLHKILFGLMSGIEDQSLSSKNRDKFTSNVETVKRSLRAESLSIQFDSIRFLM